MFLARLPVTCAAGGDKTNVLVVGGGGREHALCWRLAQSATCGTVRYKCQSNNTLLPCFFFSFLNVRHVSTHVYLKISTFFVALASNPLAHSQPLYLKSYE